MRYDPLFQLIPVIDLKDGYVVHAKAGNRSEYQAIHLYSKLVKESSIDVVIAAFKQIYSFKTFYIADLNAISNQGNHQALISSTLAKNTEYDFWIDAGKQQGKHAQDRSNYMTVYGTEVQESELETMCANEILSLDFKQGEKLGPENWFLNDSSWPEQIIIMNLDYVGSDKGPDLSKLSGYVKKYPDKKIYAAGGVRNNSDLEQLKHTGVAGVLLASALHLRNLDLDEH